MNETRILFRTKQSAADARSAEFVVPGMGSDHCAGIVSGSIRRLTGVGEVSTSIANHRVTVRFDPAGLDPAKIKAAVERAGHDVAAVGLLHPMIGVIAMVTSSLSVIGNSVLLKRARLSVKR